MGKPWRRTAFVSELKYGHKNNAVLYKQPFSIVRIRVSSDTVETTLTPLHSRGRTVSSTSFLIVLPYLSSRWSSCRRKPQLVVPELKLCPQPESKVTCPLCGGISWPDPGSGPCREEDASWSHSRVRWVNGTHTCPNKITPPVWLTCSSEQWHARRLGRSPFLSGYTYKEKYVKCSRSDVFCSSPLSHIDKYAIKGKLHSRTRYKIYLNKPELTASLSCNE